MSVLSVTAGSELESMFARCSWHNGCYQEHSQVPDSRRSSEIDKNPLFYEEQLFQIFSGYSH